MKLRLEINRENNCQSETDRIDEIRVLDQRLKATALLEDLKNTTHYLQNFVHEPSRYYLIRYNHASRMVEVKPYFSALEGTASLGDVEHRIEVESADEKVVLVEVDKIEGLVDAYPNYFGDVSLFIRNLKAICTGKDVIEYSMAPQHVVKPKPQDRPDPSWLYNRKRRWTEDTDRRRR